MTLPIAVYLEVGSKRTFAAAIEWPGWCRAGRDEAGALESLLAYAPRYATVVGRTAGFSAPADSAALSVVERIEGNATTDFGAPGGIPAVDQRPLDEAALERHALLLQATWRALDRALEAAEGVTLRKGPRGGGRDQAKITSHVLDAERSYLAKLGGKPGAMEDPSERMAALRNAVLAALSARARDEPIERPSGTRSLWPPRYFIRRAAWHVLDHAWEIQDRATP